MNKIFLQLALATPFLVALACICYGMYIPVMATGQMWLIIGAVFFVGGWLGLVLTLAIAQYGKAQRGE